MLKLNNQKINEAPDIVKKVYNAKKNKIQIEEAEYWDAVQNHPEYFPQENIVLKLTDEQKDLWINIDEKLKEQCKLEAKIRKKSWLTLYKRRRFRFWNNYLELMFYQQNQPQPDKAKDDKTITEKKEEEEG